MKYVFLMIAVFMMFIIGYLMEPALRDAMTPELVEQEPAVVEVEKPSPVDVPSPEPEPVATVEPEAEDEDGKPPIDLSDNEIRRVMQQSIQDAEIKHFTIGQVTTWKDFGEEENDGVTYQFGLLDYRDESGIFGPREFEAKALIRNGKVEKWIWTSNGMQIP